MTGLMGFVVRVGSILFLRRRIRSIDIVCDGDEKPFADCGLRYLGCRASLRKITWRK